MGISFVPFRISWGFIYEKNLRLVQAIAKSEVKLNERYILGVAIQIIQEAEARFNAKPYPDLPTGMDLRTTGTTMTFGLIFKSNKDAEDFRKYLSKDYFQME